MTELEKFRAVRRRREPRPKPMKRPLGVSVLAAARDRISRVFDDFERVCVSFSGGKDSTVMLHLVGAEARRRGRRFGLLFIDWEAQYSATIEHVARCFELYTDVADPYWSCVPLLTTNATSQYAPEWTCWDDSERDRWVREMPPGAATRERFPFYPASKVLTFEEFVPAFNRWYAEPDGEPRLTAFLVGLRTGESLNRWRAIFRGDKSTYEGWPWTTWGGAAYFNAYPLYDWTTRDVWTFHGRYPELPANPIYDLMHRAGVSIHMQRICEPYGDEQRRGLWLYHLLEPETWGRVVARVQGANHGALYSRETGNVLGNLRITKPEGHTWESFATHLLESMPPATASHYRDKIAVYLKWCADHGVEVPYEMEGDTGSKDVASWRRICKTLLKNDYWCRTLSFSITKATAYDAYRRVMEGRREKWGSRFWI